MQPLPRAPAGAARNNGSGCERPPPHPPLRPALCQELASHGGAFTGTSRCCCCPACRHTGGGSSQAAPSPPQHPRRERAPLGPGLPAGLTQQGHMARSSRPPCARREAQAGTPRLAAGPACVGELWVPGGSSCFPRAHSSARQGNRDPAAACTHPGWAGAGGGTSDHGTSGKEEEEEDVGTGTSGSGPAHGCHCRW